MFTDIRTLQPVRVPRPVSPRLPPALAALFFTLYGSYSLWRHHTFQSTGYDLGIFEQGVRSYAEGRWPTSDLKGAGFPLLGDHFHPILMLLAPLYRLWPAAETLLLAQALLLAASAIPVTRLAVDRLGTRTGMAIGIAYGFSWGLQNAVAFDFHEICFAVPLLAFALGHLMRGRWGAAVAWTLPLVLVKEDLPVTVAAIGCYLVYRGRRRLGVAVAAFGLLTFVLIVFVALPSANPAGDFAYWDKLNPQEGSPWPGLGVRVLTVLAVLAPTAFIALRSPLVLLVLPTLGWRFVSSNPAYWGIGFHYSAVLMPIVFLAFVDGLRRCGPRTTRTAVGICLAVTALFSVALPLRSAPHPVWTVEERTAVARALDLIPDGATVAASNRLAPQLTNRCRVALFPRAAPEDAEWIVVALPFVGWPVSPQEEAERLAALRSEYQTVTETGRLVMLRRR